MNTNSQHDLWDLIQKSRERTGTERTGCKQSHLWNDGNGGKDIR